MTEPVRLSKRMSELGLASRREADAWIEQGWVHVDGAPAVLGQKVLPHQKISIVRAAAAEQASRVRSSWFARRTAGVRIARRYAFSASS